MASGVSRRRLLTLLGGAAFATSGVTSGTKRSQAQETTHPATGADHQMFGVTPGRTGYNARASGPTTGVNIAWSSGGPDSDTPTYPNYITLTDGSLYLRGNGSVGPVEIAPHTGEQTWVLPDEYRSITDAGFAIADDGVLYTPVFTDEGVKIAAVSIESQEQKWISETIWSGRISQLFMQPALIDSNLYLTTQETLFSISCETGEVNWQVESNRDERWYGPPAIGESHIYLVETSSTLYALGVDRGVEQWERNLRDLRGYEYYYYNPIVTQGVCYVTTNLGPIAYDAADGSVLWTQDSPGRPVSPPAAAEGIIVVGIDASETDAPTGLYAYDQFSGQEIWRFETGDIVGAKPTIADSHVYVPTSDHYLYCLQLADGEEQWSIGFRSPLTNPPIVSDNWVFVNTEGGELFGLRGEAAGPPPVGSWGNDPTDPDHDGVYEDVNGDGEFDLGDVQGFYSSQESSAVQNNPSAFDFNGDGGIDIGDVQALFEEYLGKR